MKMTLICKLKSGYITTEGDFIPEGSPVQVMGWSRDDCKLLLCKTKVHVYAESLPDTLDDAYSGNINDGLFFETFPNDLVYLRHDSHGE